MLIFNQVVISYSDRRDSKKSMIFIIEHQMQYNITSGNYYYLMNYV